MKELEQTCKKVLDQEVCAITHELPKLLENGASYKKTKEALRKSTFNKFKKGGLANGFSKDFTSQ